jgi:hypothetical protein
MNPLQYINKLFFTLSAFCCGQVFYSQIPQETSFPLEMAELIDLKICDSYTLSYFVINDSVDNLRSYNHGIIEQESDKRGLKYKKVTDNHFEVWGGEMSNNRHPYKDQLLSIDTTYSSIKKKKYEIAVETKMTKQTGVYQKPNKSTKKQYTENKVITVQMQNGAITKRWQDENEDKLQQTVVINNGKKKSNTTVNITQGLVDSLAYIYDSNNLLREMKWYNYRKHSTEEQKQPYRTYRKIIYDTSDRITRLDVAPYHTISISYRENSIIVDSTDRLIEYLLDDDGYLKSYKLYRRISDSILISQTENTRNYLLTDKAHFITHGLIICK